MFMYNVVGNYIYVFITYYIMQKNFWIALCDYRKHNYKLGFNFGERDEALFKEDWIKVNSILGWVLDAPNPLALKWSTPKFVIARKLAPYSFERFRYLPQGHPYYELAAKVCFISLIFRFYFSNFDIKRMNVSLRIIRWI
jgi:hypothetical protein